jgi:hypothetical protein
LIKADKVPYLTLNQRVEGSSPSAPTNSSRCREAASKHGKPRPSPIARGVFVPAACSRSRLVLGVRGVRTVRRCRGGTHTIKRIKGACLGNAVAMMHDRWIVNSGGRQKWHGHDHYDGPHSTLPLWSGKDSATIPLASDLSPTLQVKNAPRVAGCAQGLSCMAITRPPLVCR